ncbi:MAG: hypothetical protein KA297_26880 [Kofleriaceae bacterium]|nr:hypothetical protein [Kofleriaceae bacterium]MBP6837401.1 hypothetical protein [Kofleriaceae bacterium]
MIARPGRGSPPGGLVVACLLLSAACSFTPGPGGGDGTPDASDEPPPEVGFTFAQSTTDEAAGTHRIGVSLSAASAAAVSVTVGTDTMASTASAADASLVATTITIPAGQTSGEVELAITADDEAEESETVAVVLRSASNATIGASATHVTTISADVLPRIDFVTTSSSALEAAGAQVLTLQLTSPAPGPIELAYVVAGSALAPDDHGLVTGTMTIAADATSASLPLVVIDDVSDEDDETVHVEIAVTSGAVAGPNTTRDHLIGDDDAPPLVGFSAATTTLTDGGEAQLTVTLAPASGKTVTVSYGLSDSTTVEAAEYALPPGPLTFAPGQTSQTITIPFTTDTVDEDDEVLDLALSMLVNASDGPIGVHRVTLVDDDAAPTLTMAPSSVTLGEGAGSTDLTVSLSAASERVVTFSLETTSATASAGDFSLDLGPHTINPGSTGIDVPFAATSDSTDETDEIVVAGITSPVNAVLSATRACSVTLDDDDGPTVRFDPSDGDQTINEGSGGGFSDHNYDVILSTNSVQTVSVAFVVSGDANDADRTVLTASPLTFAPGVSRRSITIRVFRDNSNENDNDVVLTLTSATDATVGAPTVRTHTINNDD